MSACYLYLGPELGEKNDALSAIRAKLSGGGKTALEETSFYAGQTPAARIAEVIMNASLFCDERLFVIKNAVEIKKKEAQETLAPCLKNLPAHTTAVFLSDETKVEKELENCFDAKNKKIFYEMFEDKKNEWLRGFWKRAGYTIDEDAIETLLELVENNTEAMRTECSRLQLFLDKTKPVTSADIEKWLAHTRTETPFTLFAALAARDISKSVEIMRSLLADSRSNNSVGILAGLTWCFTRLRDYEALVERGEANDFELRKIGLASPLMRKDYQAMHKNYAGRTGGFLPLAEHCLSLTAEFDIRCRESGGQLEGILMDYYLYKIIALGRRA